MIEIIEHLLKPLITLYDIYHFLKPGGRLVITTPNTNGWRAKLDKFSDKVLNFAQSQELVVQPCQIDKVIDSAINLALEDWDWGINQYYCQI